MLKYSRQREFIKNNLISRCDHPTADMVYEDIRKEYPNVSLGTVYRNLTLLSELGEIRRISTGVGPERYDGNLKSHSHFTCRHCGRVSDVFVDSQEAFVDEISAGFQGRIESSSFHFFGICEECLSEKSESAAVSE